VRLCEEDNGKVEITVLGWRDGTYNKPKNDAESAKLRAQLNTLKGNAIAQ
jgi:hypothetical protein